MRRCLVIQPIHREGLAALDEWGIETVFPADPEPRSVLSAIAGAQAVITRNAGLSGKAMEAGADLRLIGVHGIGTDPVDVNRASELGIPVFSTPTANVVSVAEQTIGLMLAVAKKSRAADEAVRRGDFAFKYTHHLVELAGKTFGAIGWGRIGQAAARMARTGFGMQVLVYSPSADKDAVARDGGEKVDDLHELLSRCDVVSLHLPLRPSTRHLIGHDEFRAMKPGAILINTGRGQTTDENALIAALQDGKLEGAGLDVFETESMPASYRLLHLDNVILSPHIGGSTEEALRRTAVEVAQGVIAGLRGERPKHLVNPQVWPGRCRAAQATG